MPETGIARPVFVPPRPRRWPWRLLFGSFLIAALVVPWLVSSLSSPSRSVFRPPHVERGDAADWIGRIEELHVLPVDDPADRFLFLSGFVGPDPTVPVWLQLHGWLRPRRLFVFDLEERRPVAALRDTRPDRFEVPDRQWALPVGIVHGKVILDATVAGPRGDFKGQFGRLVGLIPRGASTWHSQLWQFEPDSGDLTPWPKSREIGRGWRSPLSPDGRYRVDGSPGGLVLYQPRTGAKLPIAVSVAGWMRDIVWLPDSKSFLLADENELQEIEVQTGSVRWSRRQAALTGELLGSPASGDGGQSATARVFVPSRVVPLNDGVAVQMLAPPAEAPASATQLLVKPGGEQMAWQMLLDAGPWRPRQRDPIEVLASRPQPGPIKVVTAPSAGNPANVPDDPDWELVLLELPPNSWRRLGPANRRTTYDLAATRRIEFVPQGGERAAIRSTMLATGESRELAIDVPVPTSLHLTKDPNRLFWTSARCELWMLPLEGDALPEQLWPAPKDGK